MIFKIHYGLWYGGLVGIIPFMFNYAAEYSGATATQHGILYTILPFIALLAKPLVCSIADKYAAHHNCLLLFISLTILGFGSLAIYPFFPTWTSEHKSIVWVLYCFAAFLGNTSMCVVNSIGDSLAINSCQRKEISYGQYRLWGPVGFGIFGAIWGIANEIPSMPKYTPGILTMVAILLLNNILLAFWYDKEEFKVTARAAPLEYTRTETTPGSAIPAPNYGSTNQLAIITVSGNHQSVYNTQPNSDSAGTDGGDNNNINMNINSNSKTTTTTTNDNVNNQQQINNNNNTSTNDNNSTTQHDNDRSSASSASSSSVSSKQMRRLNLLARLIREDNTVLIFIFIFTFCGMMTGIHWQFFFKYLEQVAKDNGQSFSTVATLALPVQALGGELVFFLLSGKILMLLGASLTLIVCLFSFAARYLLYAYLIPYVSVYWILLVELLQGPAFGLMYCVLTYQANIYSEKIDQIVMKISAQQQASSINTNNNNNGAASSDVKLKKSLHATLQGLLGASFEGLGLGLGAIVGGRAYDVAPILMWQIAGYSALAIALLYFLGTTVSTVIRSSHRRTVDVEL